jgi:hypothetical protein
MLNRVINQMDNLVDTMSQNSYPPILEQYKNILENDLQGTFSPRSCLAVLFYFLFFLFFYLILFILFI